jgi:hypothetical protein
MLTRCNAKTYKKLLWAQLGIAKGPIQLDEGVYGVGVVPDAAQDGDSCRVEGAD